MTRWGDFPVSPNLGSIIYDLQGQVRFLENLDKLLTEQGCTEVSMEKRLEWLKNRFGELQMYREIDDGSTTALITRFSTVLQANNSWWHPGSPIEVLQMALENLLQFLALRKSLQEMEIFVRFESLYPDQESEEST